MSQFLLTVKDVSSFLRVHPKTLYKWKDEGRIPCVKINGRIRFKKQDIDNWQNVSQHAALSVIENLPDFMLSLEKCDKVFLKERSNALSKRNLKRWNYGFGAIFTKKTKQGRERWYVDYQDERGKRIQRVVKHAQSRGEALIELQARVHDAFSRHNRLRPRKEKIEFERFSEVYLEDYSRINKRSWKTDRSCLKSLKEFFCGFYLGDITSQNVERYKAERLAQGVTRSTANRDLAILRKMLNLAVEWGYLFESEVPKIKLFPERDNLKERILTAEEEVRLFEASSEHLKPVLKVALHTGMRRGEILNLRWGEVDLEAEVVKAVRTKSGKVRLIPLNDVLLEEFEKLRRAGGEGESVFPYKSVRSAFEGACRRAAIKNLRFHDLRHTFATRLVKRGVDLITIKELLGHSSVTITERYTHSFKEQKRNAVCALAEKEAGISESLLNICETGQRGKKKKGLRSLFSVN